MDDIYKSQLEKFGIEANLLVEGNPDDLRRLKYAEAMMHVVQNIMDTMDGRQWMYYKLALCGVFATPFAAGKPDVSAFLAGMQEIGHVLQNDIMNAAPDKYFLMVQEEQARRVNEEAKEEKSGSSFDPL